MSTLRRCFARASLLALALLAPGCGALLTQERVAQAQVVRVPESRARVPDPAGSGVLEIVTPAATLTNWTTNTIWAPRPQIVAALETGAAVGALVPAPLGGALAGLFGLSTLVLGWIAKVKSERAALLPAVISGVEFANSPQVKGHIKLIAAGLGLERKLNRVVKEITQ